jgi:hypothetical protein
MFLPHLSQPSLNNSSTLPRNKTLSLKWFKGSAGFHQVDKSPSPLMSFSYDIEEGCLKISQIEKTPEGVKTTYVNYLPLERLLRIEERHVSRQNQLFDPPLISQTPP